MTTILPSPTIQTTIQRDEGSGFGSAKEMKKADTEENELEEGELVEEEACAVLFQYERNFDPDIHLSHIGDKVQCLLGHFLNDFEDGGQKENMGARYGAYGSFLSSSEQSPIDLSHARISQSPQSNSIPGYTYNISKFNQQRNFGSGAGIGENRISTSLFRFTTVPNVKYISDQDVCLPSVWGTGKISAKHMTTDVSNNSIEQKSLEVSTTMGSKGTGLDSYPPLSENISAQRRKLSPETPETSDESPRSILEDMTSFPVHGECLLSPLPECLLCLTEARACTKLISVDSPLSVPQKRKTTDLEGSESYPPEAQSPAKRKCSYEFAASEVIKEGNDLREKANGLKNCGSKGEHTILHFQAAMKFLHGAFLLEPCSNEIAKHREMTDSMVMYREAAILCGSVANEYKRCNKMTAAALAYKCMEVAYMKIVYSKVPNVTKDRNDLQIGQVTNRQEESPLSSGSDVDNLPHQEMQDSNVASQLTACRASDAGNRPINRVLNFVQYVLMAMEASKKCEQALAAAMEGSEESKYAASISLAQKLTSFSFQNVDRLISLVPPTIESISQ